MSRPGTVTSRSRRSSDSKGVRSPRRRASSSHEWKAAGRRRVLASSAATSFAINHRAMRTMADFATTVKELKPGARVLALVQRGVIPLYTVFVSNAE